jgi:hypothetical protein
MSTRARKHGGMDMDGMKIDIQYGIGGIVYFRGKKYEVTTEPYERHGHMWQDAESGGRVITVPTPGEKTRNIQRARDEYASSQAGFKRLHENTTNGE